MKAIVIAAGMGNRLNPLTNDKPKCLLLLTILGRSIWSPGFLGFDISTGLYM